MGKLIRTIFEDEYFDLYEQTTGFYLWDKVLQMNVSMHEKTEQSALFYALRYYQKRLTEVKKEHDELSQKVNAFITQVCPEEETDDRF